MHIAISGAGRYDTTGGGGMLDYERIEMLEMTVAMLMMIMTLTTIVMRTSPTHLLVPSEVVHRSADDQLAPWQVRA
jgi:5,10-methenyltetrahydromethanopterin hydrogenase